MVCYQLHELLFSMHIDQQLSSEGLHTAVS